MIHQRMCFAFLCLMLASATARSAQIEDLAGTGVQGFAGDQGPAASAQLHGPTGLIRAADGSVYFCDTDNQAVRKISAAGVISTLAGNGHRGYSGDGGPASAATLNEPFEVRIDPAGNLYFCERLNHVIRRIDAKTGTISTLAGTGKPGFSGDGGPATAATFKEPHSLQFGPDGNLYVCDIGNNRIRRIDMKSGVITTFAGNGQKKPTPDDAPFVSSPLNGPRAIDFDLAGNLWVALREGNTVVKLDLHTGRAHHMAGTGKKGFTGNGGPALQATLSGPKGIAVGPDGSVYLADTESHSIRRIDPKTDTIDLVAGTGERGDGPSGPPTACKLSRPHGIFVASDGTIFIGDTECNKLRVIRANR